MKKRIVVLISGNGSNLQAIMDACANSTLPDSHVVKVYSNKSNVYGLFRAKDAGIPYCIVEPQKGEQRTAYDTRLAALVKQDTPHLIVLAGWMRILTSSFIREFNPGQIINIHPALPGQFPGPDGIGDAWTAYMQGKITQTGLMIHEVVEDLDAGRVLETEVVQIRPTDTVELLTKRVQAREKLALINAIYNKLFKPEYPEINEVYVGKVRQMYDLGYKRIAMEHSDRLSAFDRQICVIPGKGKLLLEISKWWFHRTKHIIDNHYVWDGSNVMIVKQCKPIPIEVVVRGYITGSTKTSMWTHYENAKREYCGHILPEGLRKHQRLPSPLVTPTTKSASDELISPLDIVDKGILTYTEWSRIEKVALELYEHGQTVAAQHNLILADTKYEFGYCNGKLLLIDELHTPDSSRYWIMDSYKCKMENGEEPERLDKDCIREYLRSLDSWDPYNVSINVPEIPEELIAKTYQSYAEVLRLLTNEDYRNHQKLMSNYQPLEVTLDYYWNQIHSPTILIAYEFGGDQNAAAHFISEAKSRGIYCKTIHMPWLINPGTIVNTIKDYTIKNGKYVWVVLLTNDHNPKALATFVATHTYFPVQLCSGNVTGTLDDIERIFALSDV